MSNLPGKSLFPTAQQIAYLDTAAEGIPPSTLDDAFAAYLRAKDSGTPGRTQLYAMEKEATASAARLLNTSPDNIALLGSASEGLNSLANSIDWRAGDEVLISDFEFPSNVIGWLRLAARGVRLEVIPSGGAPSLDQFLERIRPNTRVVSVSQVSYKTGAQLPFLCELAEAAHRAGALFCVDATQALGRVPVSVEGVDFLVASSYKWLLSSHGVGVTYLAPALRERLRPSSAGWYSVTTIFTPDRFERFDYKAGANRLQPGMPNFPALYALNNGIGFLLSIGVETIDRELAPLVRRLREGIAELGLALLTPATPGLASGIVSFAHPQAEALGQALARERVIVWSGDGRVRASVHLYNDKADIARFLEVLRLAQGSRS